MHVDFVLRMPEGKRMKLDSSAPWLEFVRTVAAGGKSNEIYLHGAFVAVDLCDLCHKIVFLNTYGFFTDFAIGLLGFPTYGGRSGCRGCSRFDSHRAREGCVSIEINQVD